MNIHVALLSSLSRWQGNQTLASPPLLPSFTSTEDKGTFPASLNHPKLITTEKPFIPSFIHTQELLQIEHSPTPQSPFPRLAVESQLRNLRGLSKTHCNGQTTTRHCPPPVTVTTLNVSSVRTSMAFVGKYSKRIITPHYETRQYLIWGLSTAYMIAWILLVETNETVKPCDCKQRYIGKISGIAEPDWWVGKWNRIQIG